MVLLYLKDVTTTPHQIEKNSGSPNRLKLDLIYANPKRMRLPKYVDPTPTGLNFASKSIFSIFPKIGKMAKF